MHLLSSNFPRELNNTNFLWTVRDMSQAHAELRASKLCASRQIREGKIFGVYVCRLHVCVSGCCVQSHNAIQMTNREARTHSGRQAFCLHTLPHMLIIIPKCVTLAFIQHAGLLLTPFRPWKGNCRRWKQELCWDACVWHWRWQWRAHLRRWFCPECKRYLWPAPPGPTLPPSQNTASSPPLHSLPSRALWVLSSSATLLQQHACVNNNGLIKKETNVWNQILLEQWFSKFSTFLNKRPKLTFFFCFLSLICTFGWFKHFNFSVSIYCNWYSKFQKPKCPYHFYIFDQFKPFQF